EQGGEEPDDEANGPRRADGRATRQRRARAPARAAAGALVSRREGARRRRAPGLRTRRIDARRALRPPVAARGRLSFRLADVGAQGRPVLPDAADSRGAPHDRPRDEDMGRSYVRDDGPLAGLPESRDHGLRRGRAVSGRGRSSLRRQRSALPRAPARAGSFAHAHADPATGESGRRARGTGGAVPRRPRPRPRATRAVGAAGRAAPFLAARVQEETDAGLVIRGCRMLATLPIADEIMVFPSTLLRGGDEDAPYAFGFVIPSDTPGLKF